MRRFLMPLVWPVICGVLLAIVLLNQFPQLLGTPPAALSERSQSSNEADDGMRPEPELRDAAPMSR